MFVFVFETGCAASSSDDSNNSKSKAECGIAPLGRAEEQRRPEAVVAAALEDVLLDGHPRPLQRSARSKLLAAGTTWSSAWVQMKNGGKLTAEEKAPPRHPAAAAAALEAVDSVGANEDVDDAAALAALAARAARRARAGRC